MASSTPSVSDSEATRFEDASRLRRFPASEPGLRTTLRNVGLMRRTFRGWVLPTLLAKANSILAADDPRLARLKSKLEPYRTTLRTRREGLRIRVPLLDVWPPFEVFAQREYDLTIIPWEQVERVLDVGAHVGSFSLWVSQKARCQVYAIEPNPVAAELFALNTAQLGDRVHLDRVAVGGAAGERVLYDAGYPGTSSLSRESGGARAITVEAVTLDQLLARTGFDEIDLLKMDIEGAEEEVFKSVADTTLRRIKTAIVECHPYAGGTVRTVAERLAGAGMHVACETRHAPMVVGWRS